MKMYTSIERILSVDHWPPKRKDMQLIIDFDHFNCFEYFDCFNHFYYANDFNYFNHFNYSNYFNYFDDFIHLDYLNYFNCFDYFSYSNYFDYINLILIILTILIILIISIILVILIISIISIILILLLSLSFWLFYYLCIWFLKHVFLLQLTTSFHSTFTCHNFLFAMELIWLNQLIYWLIIDLIKRVATLYGSGYFLI